MDQLYADRGFDYTVRDVWLRGNVAAGTGLGAGLGGLGGLMDLSLKEGNVKKCLPRAGEDRDGPEYLVTEHAAVDARPANKHENHCLAALSL